MMHPPLNALMFLVSFLMLGLTSQAQQENLPPHYPKIEKTGDLAKDEANWAKAKEAWIKNYPEEYRSMGGDPEAKAKPAELTTPKPDAKKELIGIDFKAHDLYKLVKIIAVDVNKKHTAQEMAGYNKEATSEFAITDLAIDWQKKMWYRKSKTDPGHEVANLFCVIDGKIQLQDCKKCSENGFTLVKHDDSSIVVQIAPQDQGQFFVYQFEFKK